MNICHTHNITHNHYFYRPNFIKSVPTTLYNSEKYLNLEIQELAIYSITSRFFTKIFPFGS